MNIGKYNYHFRGKGKKGTVYYIIKKQVPNAYRKVLVYGPTGYGKSYNLIASVIKGNENVLFISSCDMNGELEHMNPDVNVSVYNDYKDIPCDFTGRIAYDFGQTPQVKQKDTLFSEILPWLIESGITERKDVAVILDNLPDMLTEQGIYQEEEIHKWKCKVVLDFTCSPLLFDSDVKELKYLKRNGWRLIPVFAPLYRRQAD